MNPTAATFVGVLVAGIPAFMAGMFVRRRTKAEAADVITQAAARVVTDLTVALTQAQNTAADLRRELDDLKHEVSSLRRLVIQLGGDPATIRKDVTP